MQGETHQAYVYQAYDKQEHFHNLILAWRYLGNRLHFLLV